MLWAIFQIHLQAFLHVCGKLGTSFVVLHNHMHTFSTIFKISFCSYLLLYLFLEGYEDFRDEGLSFMPLSSALLNKVLHFELTEMSIFLQDHGIQVGFKKSPDLIHTFKNSLFLLLQSLSTDSFLYNTHLFYIYQT
jgi:hypothetical protein